MELFIPFSKKRCASPLSPQEMSNLEEGPTVANIKKCTDWAVWVFTAWHEARIVTQEDRCPTNLLENPSAEQLNCWLSRFVVEVRRADGERCPSATLYQLLSGLLRYVCSKSKGCLNFLDQRFAELRGTCESISRDLPAPSGEPWFVATPIGKNTLAKFVRTMCEEAEIAEKKVNHSLRATGTTALFNAEVPEKLIKEVTGHKSSKALHLYERPTDTQQEAVSKVLTAPTSGQGSIYSDHLQSLQQPISRPMLPTSRPSAAYTQQCCIVKHFDPCSLVSSMFNGLSNCMINITPQQLNIHLQPPVMTQVDEFDALVSSLPEL